MEIELQLPDDTSCTNNYTVEVRTGDVIKAVDPDEPSICGLNLCTDVYTFRTLASGYILPSAELSFNATLTSKLKFCGNLQVMNSWFENCVGEMLPSHATHTLHRSC